MEKITVREGLVTEQVGEETVIFDPVANMAHTLDGAASRVWQELATTSDPEVIASRTDLSEAQVLGTIERLVAIDLVKAPGVSRRVALRRLAIAGAAATQLPAIVSLAIPAAASAASAPGGGSLGSASGSFIGSTSPSVSLGGSSFNLQTSSSF